MQLIFENILPGINLQHKHIFDTFQSSALEMKNYDITQKAVLILNISKHESYLLVVRLDRKCRMGCVEERWGAWAVLWGAAVSGKEMVEGETAYHRRNAEMR